MPSLAWVRVQQVEGIVPRLDLHVQRQQRPHVVQLQQHLRQHDVSGLVSVTVGWTPFIQM